MNTFLQDFQGLADLVPYRIDGQIQFLSNLLVRLSLRERLTSRSLVTRQCRLKSLRTVHS